MSPQKVVFVVDDDAALVAVLATVLEQVGLEVATFTSPTTALAAAASRKPDLLMTDFRVPEMDGLTLAAKMTALHPDCKVLMMSGDIQNTAGHYGQFELLQKPLRISAVLAKVKGSLAEQ